ncbi:MAG TPA: hypothetical protein VNO70_06490 [Blastocatellia bacterium]|nr:hypothetical protein [Blastocatellia bacterium]
MMRRGAGRQRGRGACARAAILPRLHSLAASLFLLVILSPPSAIAQSRPKTEVRNERARQLLLGKHKFQLHWISWGNWKDFADLTVTDKNGTFVVKGRQEKSGDYVEVDGIVLMVDDRVFTFQGTIITRVSHNNEGQPCKREGTFTFKITGKRKYWRMQEYESPCDGVADYVDIFLR